MTLLHQAAQKAVEALTSIADFDQWNWSDRETVRQMKVIARAALESAALQHQEVPGEPVAWLRVDGMKAMPADEKDAWIEAGSEKVCADYTIPLYASPSTTRQQEVGSVNGELSKPMPTLLAQRIVGALECGALWAEGSEAHPRILKTLADFNTWIVRQDAVSALSDEEIAMIARGMPMPPWGIGSRREDAIAFARLVLATAPSTPEKAGAWEAPMRRTIISLGSSVGLAAAVLAASSRAVVSEPEPESRKRISVQPMQIGGEWATKPAHQPKKGKPTKAEKKAAKRARARALPSPIPHPLPAQANDGGEHG